MRPQIKKSFLPVVIVFSLFAAKTFSAVTSNIIVDQFGYRTGDTKVAVFSQPQSGTGSPSTFNPGTSFYLINASSGATVFTGTITQWNGGATDASSGDVAWWGDFSSYKTAGSYYVQVPGGSNPGAQSTTFTLSDTVYNAVLQTASRMYLYQRCGINITAANGGTYWNHTACHEGVSQDLTAHLYDGSDMGLPRDVHGGWHDAGDYNKYIPFTLDTIWDLLQAYLWYPCSFGDNNNIPESGNGVPDILDEVKWELDWYLRMQDTDGGVFSVVGTTTGDNNQGAPAADTGNRVYTNKSTIATATFSRNCAMGARVFAAFNAQYPGYATTLQNAAVTAWGYLQLHTSPTTYNNTNLQTTDANVNANADLRARVDAAAELFALTGSVTYQSYFDSNYNVAGIQDSGNFQPVSNPPNASNDHFDPSLCFDLEQAMVTYCQTTGATASIVTAIKNSLQNGINWAQMANLNTNDPYRAYIYSYYWGCNSGKADWGDQLLWAVQLNINPSSNSAYLAQAEEYLHYLHGRNPLNFCYLTNMGSKGANLGAWASSMSIYHSWFWTGTTFDGNTGPSAVGPAPGILVGGPNPGYAPDPSYVGTPIAPPQNEPPQKSYKDWGISWPEDSWEVTEPDQGYQAPYVMLAAAFATCGGPTPTFTPTATGTKPTATSTPTNTQTFTPTLSPTPTATLCAVLLNGCESLTENGTWTGTNATRSLSTTDVTQGTNSLQVAVTFNPSGGWNDQVFNLGGFTPTNFSNVYQLKVDVNLPAGLQGTTYSQLFLSGDSAPTTYEQSLASNYVNLNAGQNNNLTFNISLTGAFTPSSPITKIYFIYNSDCPVTGASTYGNLYVDNIRLVESCASAPTPTNSPTSTSTKTATLTPTSSPTATSSATASPTSTSTSTVTNSFTVTPTLTPTFTATSTITGTPTNTATGTVPTATNTPTNTPSNTATNTPTLTATFTPTKTASSTATNTATGTPTASSTNTATLPPTPTFTVTPTPVATSVLIYPNPADGTQPLQILIPLGVSTNVRVQLFTTAFRKVQDTSYPFSTPGKTLSLSLNDMSGIPLASGLYYVVVSTSQSRFIQKLIILR